ncbi:MAG: S8 family serine peptidase [Nitrospira sp.]
MLYAAGLPNSSGTTPLRPAQIINMSLGGPGSCGQVPGLQQTIDKLRARGISIVVAAGNDAESDTSTGLTNPITIPASCRGVIAVGAVTSQLKHASYSTHHPYVFIAAPGGEIDRTPFEGILSTMKVSKGNVPQYQYSKGTSMAAPHVAGVIALMLSVNPSLTPNGIEQILEETAIDLGLPTLPGRDSFFGHGLVRADLAVARSAGTLVPRMPIPYPQPTIVIFDSATGTEDVKIDNVGLPPLQLSSVTVETNGSGSWLTAQLLDSNTLRVSVDGRGLSPALYTGAVGVLTNDGSGVPLIVPVAMRLPSQGLPDVGPITVFLRGWDPVTGQPLVRTTTTDRTQAFAYNFPSVAPGQYEVFAVKDKDENDGDWGSHPDDLLGMFPFIGEERPITVEAGKETQNINFPIIKGQTIITTDK